MTAILDTSFLFALTNRSDKNHERVVEVARGINEELVLPVTVLPEICYLLATRLNHHAMRQFLTQLLRDNIAVENTIVQDLSRATQILNEYADSHLDFVDATIVSVAERLQVSLVLTLDRRDFTIIRPRHVEYFELLP